MKGYFLLQFKMLNRSLTAFGFPPLLAYILLPVCFVGLSGYLFSKTEFAEYIFLLLAFALLSKQTGRKRNEFLKSCFTRTDYIKLRLLENFVLMLPFAMYLIFAKAAIFVIPLVVIAIVFVFITNNTTIQFTIPTPFYKKPFEFSVGFRNTFFFFPIAYILTYIAVSEGNFNLGLFSIILVFLVAMSYYSKLENEYYIWSYSLSSNLFLIEKIKTALGYITVLVLPILITLSIYFTTELTTLFTFLLIAYAYLITVILAKYTVYPNEMNIPQGILIAISLLFPPILIGIIPYFFFQSKKRLTKLLP